MSARSSRQPPSYYLRRAVDTVIAAPVITGVTLTSIAISVLFAGAVTLVASNAYRMVALWSTSGVDVSLYLSSKASNADVVRLREQVQAQPGVSSVDYVSSEEAWQFLADNLGDSASLLEGLDSSLLPASLELTLAPGAVDAGGTAAGGSGLAARLEALRGLPGVDDVQYNTYDFARRARALELVGWVAWALGAIALLASVVLVTASFQLAAYSRREELEVIRLMGAVGKLYWGPLLLAAMLEGLVASGAALGLLAAVYWTVSLPLTRELPLLAAALGFLSPLEILGLVGWGALLGVFGVLAGLWRSAAWR